MKRELRSLFVLYPQLESMAVSRVGDSVTFVNAKGACQFLDADNRCRIEKDHGKSLKPTVCSLFPFNSFSRIGRTLTVSPHFLWPLRLSLPASPGEVEGTHATLEAGLRESEVLSKEYLSTMVSPLWLHPSTDAVTGALEEVIKPEMPVSDRSVLFQRLGNLVDQRRFKTTKRKPTKDVGASRELN